MHRFEVWAVDNTEMLDPSPAKIHFWTLPSPGLTVWVASGPGLTATPPYVLSHPTERNPGLTFTFAASDPSTNERDFSWAVDDTANWSAWSPDAFAIVTAASFEETGSDTHMFFMRGRNKWGVLSSIVTHPFSAAVPPIDDPNWPKKIMIINNCRITDPPPPPPPKPSEWLPPVTVDDVNQFYIDVLAALGKTEGVDYTIYVTSSNSYRFPIRDTLARYTSVILLTEQDLADAGLGALTRMDAAKQSLLYDYLDIGGKLIFSGSPNVRLLFGGATTTTWETLAWDIFHIDTSVHLATTLYNQNDAFDLIRTEGILGYPDLNVDTTKLPPIATGAIANVAVNFPRGFGQTISEFDSRSDHILFEGQPVGVRYLAPPPIPPARQTYSVVYFGVPLYYMMKDDVIETLRKAFEDINE
jgi:hypothetical protein